MRLPRLAAFLAVMILAPDAVVAAETGAGARMMAASSDLAVLEILWRGEAFPDGPPVGLDPLSMRAAAIRYARAVLGLRVDPGAINPLWAISAPPRGIEAEVDAHIAAGDLGPWLATLGPRDPRYKSLLAWRSRYADAVDSGGWTPLPPGGVLRLGSRGAGVPALRRRLSVEGYELAAAASDEIFDAGLARAVTQFQARHELPADGRVDPATRQALDVTAEQRLAQIDANLERWRWTPLLPAERVEVDAAGATAALYVAGQVRLRMRAVTGDPKHKTPIFASRIEAVVFNPPWNVPASIAQQELWPKERAHPGYLRANQFKQVDGRLQQAPGPRNALGVVKFDLPSRFGVYLHDTPGKAAFDHRERHLSHGCIRLAAPRELAAALLAPQDWSRTQVDEVIAQGATRRVALTHSAPVFVFYWTAMVDEAGALVLRADPYGWDAELTRAFAGKSP